MTDKERQNLYANYTTSTLLPVLVVEIDLKRTYAYNKKKILDSIEWSQGINKGKKYYKSKSGVWCVNDDDNVYDVYETASIVDEMIKALGLLYSGKKYVRCNVYKKLKRNRYRVWKYQQIYKNLKKDKKVYLTILLYEEDKRTRLIEEMKYAISKQAKFWSWSPLQKKLSKEL